MRMLATGGLLGLLYVVFAVVLLNVLNVGLAPMIVIIVAIAFFQYYTSDELALVANRDVLVMTVASFFAMLAGLITRWGFYFGMWGGGFGGGNRNDNNNQGGVPVFVIVLAVSVV